MGNSNSIKAFLEVREDIEYVLNKEKELLREQKILRHKKTILLNEKKVIENKLLHDTQSIYIKQWIKSGIEGLIITAILIFLFFTWGFNNNLSFLKTCTMDTLILCFIYSPTLIIPFVFLVKRKKQKLLKNIFLFYIIWLVNLIIHLIIIEVVSFNTNYNFPIISLTYSFLFFIFGSIYIVICVCIFNYSFNESKLNNMKISYYENKDLWEKKYAKFKEEENKKIRKLNDEYIYIQNKISNDPYFKLFGRKNLSKEYINNIMRYATDKGISSIEDAIKLYNKNK